MKKLFTLFAFLAIFMGAKAETIVDAEMDFSQYTDISQVPFASWRGSDAAFARLSIQNGCLHFHSEEATDPSWDCQFFPIGGVDAEVGVTYTLHYKIKGDHAAGVSMLGFGQTPYGQFQITTDWVEGTVDYECTSADGNILMQCGDYVGDWDIAYLKITHEGKRERPAEWIELLTNGNAEKDWEDPNVRFNDQENNYKICFWTKEKGVNVNEDGGSDPHPAEIITEPNGNRAFICRATLADTEGDPAAWDNQIWFQSPRAWKTGEQFRLSFRYKASVNVGTQTQYHKQNPSDYLHWQAIGDINFTTEWQEFEQVITIPSDANGAWSIAFNLNPNNKDPMDFYIDDLSWSQMKLDEGLFITGANTETGFVEHDFDNATEFEYDAENEVWVATIGTEGKQESWVNEAMISTVRGNDRQFKANTIKASGAVVNDEWVDFVAGSTAKIKLPAQGVWEVSVSLAENVMMFHEIEGDKPKDPIVITPNPSEIFIETVERAYTMDEAKNLGLVADPENPTQEEKDLYNGQPWDNQFFLIGNRTLEVGEEVVVEFDYKSENDANVGTQNSEGAGGYLHWAGLGSIDFTSEWNHFEGKITIPGETSNKQNSFTFNLANAKEANKFWFTNIVFKLADDTETLIDMETENPDNFQKKVGASSGPEPTGIQGVIVNKAKVSTVTYNIAGQRVSNNYKGIVIKNGVKVLK